MEISRLEGIIEAILFTMGDSVELSKIASAIGHDEETTRKVIHNMMDKYETDDRGIHIIELEDSFQMCTKPQMYEYLIKVAKQPRRYVLTDVQLETLSIIAYRQPVTKLEIEKIRGVKSDHAVNKLVEYGISCVRWEGWMRQASPFCLGRQKSFCGVSASILWKIFRASIRNRSRISSTKRRRKLSSSWTYRHISRTEDIHIS